MSITASLPPALARPTIVHHLVLVALLVITSINYIQRNCLSPLVTTIQGELEITGPFGDQLISAFFWAYTLLQVPSSWLARRWGPRLALTIFAAGWSLATLACALASNFLELYVARLALGILQAGIFPCCTLILAVWYPPSKRGVATALLNSFMLMGGAASATLTGVLMEPLGWRGVFTVFSIPGLIWSVWFIWWFRNRPEDHNGVNPAELDVIRDGKKPEEKIESTQITTEAKSPAPTSSWLILLSLPLIMLWAQQGFRAAANRLFDSRLPTYLEHVRGVSKAEAAVLSSVPMWVGIGGGITGGTLSDWLVRRSGSRRIGRKGLAMVSLFACTAIYLLAYAIPNVYGAMAALSVGFFVFCFSSPCAYALSMDMSGKHLAIVFGMLNMIGNLGASVFTSTTMMLVEYGGWDLALGVWLSLHLLALVCWAFLDAEVVFGEERPKE